VVCSHLCFGRQQQPFGNNKQKLEMALKEEMLSRSEPSEVFEGGHPSPPRHDNLVRTIVSVSALIHFHCFSAVRPSETQTARAG
jgi:hypothetical protein